jgi:hypothetical protein
MIDFITGFGYWLGIDFLFWAWAIVTVIAFIDLFIPDPIPYVDEAFLIGTSIILLLVMAARGSVGFFGVIKDAITNPAVIGFAVTMAVLLIGGKVLKERRGKKK